MKKFNNNIEKISNNLKTYLKKGIQTAFYFYFIFLILILIIFTKNALSPFSNMPFSSNIYEEAIDIEKLDKIIKIIEDRDKIFSESDTMEFKNIFD